MVPRTTPAARTALDHEWLKASPLLVAHQTPDQDSLPKSYLESDTGPFGNPLCQQALVQVMTDGNFQLTYLRLQMTGVLVKATKRSDRPKRRLFIDRRINADGPLSAQFRPSHLNEYHDPNRFPAMPTS